jgi:hypothetical protein
MGARVSVVPSTVDSIREQIVEAVKLSIGSHGKCIAISQPWGIYSTSTDYPLVKAWMTTSVLSAEYMGTRDIREDDLNIMVVPLCDELDFPLLTSKIIESFRPYFNTETVRGFMHATYSESLAKLTVQQAEVVQTDIAKPYAGVKFLIKAKYQVI